MEEEADGLPVHEELPGDVAGAAADEEGDAVDAPASEASCLNMNPMFKALPCMPVKAHAGRGGGRGGGRNSESQCPGPILYTN